MSASFNWQGKWKPIFLICSGLRTDQQEKLTHVWIVRFVWSGKDNVYKSWFVEREGRSSFNLSSGSLLHFHNLERKIEKNLKWHVHMTVDYCYAFMCIYDLPIGITQLCTTVTLSPPGDRLLKFLVFIKFFFLIVCETVKQHRIYDNGIWNLWTRCFCYQWNMKEERP